VLSLSWRVPFVVGRLIATCKRTNRPAEAGNCKSAALCGGTAGIFLSFLACDGKQENYEELPFAIHGAGDTLAHVTRKRPLRNGGVRAALLNFAYLWTAPRWQEGSGLGLIRSIANIYSASPSWFAQMGNPLTLSSTNGRPRRPLCETGFECDGSTAQPHFSILRATSIPFSRCGAVIFAASQHGPDYPCVLIGDRNRRAVIAAPQAQLVDPHASRVGFSHCRADNSARAMHE
jgi:hypothetical protein